MRWKPSIVFMSCILLPVLLQAAGAEAFPRGPVAFVDCTLIDGTGSAPVPNAVVLVADGRIQAAGASARVEVPGGCARVSLHGAFLLPGFFNAHVHYAYDPVQLHAWLSSGVTTVRDLGPFGTSSAFILDRDRLNGDPRNARLVSSTPLITRPGGYGGSHVDGPEDARVTVRSFIRRGVDIIKIAIEDDLQGSTWPILGAAAIDAMVKEAHGAGKKVSAHISHVRNLPLAINGGVDDLAHMVVEPLTETMARTIAAKGIAWVPTLELWKGVSKKHSLDWDRIAIRNTGVFFRAGGIIALGTDYAGYSIPFDKGFPITEVRLLMEAGLSAMDVIVAGTRNAAMVSGLSGELGTVAPGKIADLIVVSGDPLKDVSFLEKPVRVFKSGLPVAPGE